MGQNRSGNSEAFRRANNGYIATRSSIFVSRANIALIVIGSLYVSLECN